MSICEVYCQGKEGIWSMVYSTQDTTDAVEHAKGMAKNPKVSMCKVQDGTRTFAFMVGNFVVGLGFDGDMMLSRKAAFSDSIEFYNRELDGLISLLQEVKLSIGDADQRGERA
jgi:hypothetical protein